MRYIKSTIILISLLPLIFLIQPNPASAAAITSYSAKKQITYDTSASGANITTNQSWFPVAVHINASSWPNVGDRNLFFNNSWNPGGKRIQFFDYDQTTSLPYEVEYYSTSNQEAIYWVRVPTVYQSGDANYSNRHFIYIAYGSDPDGLDYHGYGTYALQQQAVWSENGANNFKGVWHLGEDVTDESTGGTHYDSTSGGNNGAQNNNSETSVAVGYGQDFDGAGDYINIGDKAESDSAITISFWVKPDAGNKNVLGKYGTNYQYRVLMSVGFFSIPYIYQNNTTYSGVGASVGSGNTAYISNTNKTTSAGGDGYTRCYKNGSLDVTDTTHSIASIANTSESLTFGGYAGTYNFDGQLDEIRISDTERSADWVKLEYYSMKKTAYNGDNGAGSGKFITFGSQQGPLYASIFHTTDADFNGTHDGSPAHTVVDTGNGFVRLTRSTDPSISVSFPYCYPSCSGGGGTYTAWTVPNRVTIISVDIAGAQGSAKGALVQTNRSVTPGDILNVFIGGASSGTSGGYNGGGNGGTGATFNGAGGGGASDIRFGGTTITPTDYRVMIAGGGGGSGSAGGGGGVGGYNGSNGGSGTCGGGGGGGTQTAGGGGGGGCYINGLDGSRGQGGNGACCGYRSGGGGAGGFFGGGGGGSANGGLSPGGGGGGSSYTPDSCTSPTVCTSGAQSGNGSATIYYPPYYSTGTYFSPIFQRAQLASWGNLNYGADVNGQVFGIKVRSCALANCSGADDWGTCTAITSGNTLASGGCVDNSEKYIQYIADFSSDGSNTPYLNDITLDYFYNPDVSTISGIVKFFGSIIFK